MTQSPAQSSPLTSKNVTVLLPHTKATAGSNPLPAYPKLSKRLKEQGTVFISLRVLRDGSVAHVHVKKSSGFTRLDAAALKAVKDWRYTPAMKNNKPIDFDYSQPVLFALQ